MGFGVRQRQMSQAPYRMQIARYPNHMRQPRQVAFYPGQRDMREMYKRYRYMNQVRPQNAYMPTILNVQNDDNRIHEVFQQSEAMKSYLRIRGMIYDPLLNETMS